MQRILQLQAYCESIHCKCLPSEPMTQHTTFKIGGNAELFIEPTDVEQLRNVLSQAKNLGIKVTIIGNGSDLLVDDKGIEGAVICLSGSFASIENRGDKAIYCTAGTSLSQLCYNAYQNGLSGLEFAWGIPGNVGGAVYMNAGAYGGEMKDALSKVWYLDEALKIQERSIEQLEMTYRHSFFTDKPLVIVGALFTLEQLEQTKIKEKMDGFMDSRKSKQPLEYPSAGSTFKRPVGAYAAALIEECGLKGVRVGGASVSQKHAGFVINHDHATCQDVLSLIAQIQDTVKKQTGFTLECEVKLIS